MTSGEIQHDAAITNFTLALFEDSGWYEVNRTAADSILWGKN